MKDFKSYVKNKEQIFRDEEMKRGKTVLNDLKTKSNEELEKELASLVSKSKESGTFDKNSLKDMGENVSKNLTGDQRDQFLKMLEMLTK